MNVDFHLSVVARLLQGVRSQRILDVGGLSDGLQAHWQELLDAQPDAEVVAVDPGQRTAGDQRGSNRLRVIHELSLNAIPRLTGAVDFAFLHGDPNWYTALHELRLLARLAEQFDAPFPVVAMHNVGWPYGRRDGYHDPSRIPEAHRHPAERRGLRPDTGELVDDGLDTGLFNSIYEMPIRSGVLTAMEDFIAESRIDASFVLIPGHGGLGLLVPRTREGAADTFMASLVADPQAALIEAGYLDSLDAARIQADIDRDCESRRTAVATTDLQQVREEADGLRMNDQQLRAAVERLQVERARLLEYADAALHHTDRLLTTRRWRIGNAIGNALNTLHLRPRTPMVTDQLAALKVEYAGFRRSLSSVPAASVAAHDTMWEMLAHGPEDRDKYDVMVFPVIDWSFRFQRPQHLSMLMAERGHRVFYFATTPVRAAGFDEIRVTSPAPGVYCLPLPYNGTPPRMPGLGMSDLQAGALKATLAAFRDRVRSASSVVLVNHPAWAPLAEREAGVRVVYDCFDHHAGFDGASPKLAAWENEMIARADIVVTSSRPLQALVQEEHPTARVELIRNATDVEHFANPPAVDLLDRNDDRPVLGYFGAISSWFDSDLVAGLAAGMPDCDVVLIGSTFGADMEPLLQHGNIRLLGEVPYEKLPAYAKAFDVCLIPFRKNELTRCTNPVKLYEYLALGKPVVSIDLPEVAEVAGTTSGLVRVAADAPAFIEAVREALHDRRNEPPSARDERVAFAAGNTWHTRVGALADAVATTFPLISVVVLTYNNLAFTRACLESLEAFTDYPEWELILVDNASSDGTPAWLAQFAARRSHVKLILNDTNTGFAAGNNIGARAARGEYIVFLNNDTYVTRGWLDGLAQHLHRDPRLGIICPVTNNIGNEARIEIHYADMGEMAVQASQYTAANRGQELDLRVAPLFCAMVTRQTWQEVGELDEGFGRGFFEDDDYARRIEAVGKRVACAEDVFVHHHLSASFSRITDTERQKLFEENRRRYESKWGPWQPHRYRDR